MTRGSQMFVGQSSPNLAYMQSNHLCLTIFFLELQYSAAFGGESQGRCHGFESGGGQFCERSEQKNFFDPPTFWPVGGQNIA